MAFGRDILVCRDVQYSQLPDYLHHHGGENTAQRLNFGMLLLHERLERARLEFGAVWWEQLSQRCSPEKVGALDIRKKAPTPLPCV